MENLQPGRAGFFRMKLHPHHVAALDRRRKRLNVARDGRGVCRDWSFVRMREVDKLSRLNGKRDATHRSALKSARRIDLGQAFSENDRRRYFGLHSCNCKLLRRPFG